jgi:hypothetical protein
MAAKNIVDFQKVALDYAKSIAKERNTTVSWVSLDGTRHSHPSRKLSYQVGTPRFEWTEPVATFDLMFAQTLQNHGGQTIRTQIERSEKTKDAWKSTVSWGISTGFSIEKTIGIPKVKSTTGKFYFDFNFSSEETEEWEEERSWTLSQEVPQSPRTTTTLEWFLDRNSAECSFRVNIVIEGEVGIWFADRIAWFDGSSRHNLWFPGVGMIVSEMRRAGHELPGFEVDGLRRVTFRATGIVRADVGLHSRLRITEAPPEALRASETTQLLLNSTGRVLRRESYAS